jgi:GR25 family glycosyltransferase involved in LPS biosynthesis
MHCKKLFPRKKYISAQLTKHNFANYSFYEDYDANELDHDITEYYVDLPEERYKKYKLWFPFERNKSLTPAEISLTLKYIKVYEKIANGNDDAALIIEDDAILDDNFVNKFNTYYAETPSEYDMIFLGSGCNLRSNNIQPNIHSYKRHHPATRCTVATIVKKKTCQDILKTMKPFHLVIDWELNYQLYLHNHNVYWWEDPLVNQGSETGLFKTSLR